MASRIDNTKINANFPIPGQNNDSQGFRDNFANIKLGLGHARTEISEIQEKGIFKAGLGNTVLSNDMNWTKMYRLQLQSPGETVFDHGTKAGVVNFDFSSGTFHRVQLTSSIVAQFSNFPPAGIAGRLVIWFRVTNSQFRAFLPESVSYGLNNAQLDGRSIIFPGIGDFMVEIASIDGGVSYWFVDFANLGGVGTGGNSSGGGYTGSVGYAGSIGYAGSRGVAGNYGGVSFEYIYRFDGIGDPGNGFLRFNSAQLNAATRLDISKFDKNIKELTGFLRTVDDSTGVIKGYMKLSNTLDPSEFVIYAVGGLFESGVGGGTPGLPQPNLTGGYFLIECSYVAGVSSFSNLLDVVITFTRNGDTGYTGSIGVGYTGSAGLFAGIGATGATGPLGATGATGPLGATGPQGVPGPQGPLGTTGATGPAGSSGATGATGPQGIPGEFAGIGATGVDGYTGSIGFTGSQGIPGVAAYRGATGATGTVGSTGPIGATGMTGATGPRGIDGAAADTGYTGSRGEDYTQQPGLEGQVPFITENNTILCELDYIVKIGTFVETVPEYLAAVNPGPPDYATIFNSWLRFSHDYGTVRPANPGEVSAWNFDPVTGVISSTINSGTYIGFISPLTYSDYELEVQLSSTDFDNDNISVLCGWYKDSNTGKEYTLSAIRDTGGTSAGWQIVYNYLQSDAQVIVDGNTLVTRQNGWANFGAPGTKIKIIRAGNQFTFITTQMGNSNYDPSTQITLNLASNVYSDILGVFTGTSNYGYGAYSQNQATFTTLKFITPQNSTIYDMSTGAVYKKQSDGTWSIDPSATTYSTFGIGRILANPITKKTFFIESANSITKIADFSGGVLTFNSFNTIEVDGQTSVVADSTTDTLKLIAGTNITLTTDANADSITISAASSGGGGGPGLTSRLEVSYTGGTTNVTGFKSYALLAINPASAAWVRIYSSASAQTGDASRTSSSDPLPGTGVIAEILTTAGGIVYLTPATIGFNTENPVTDKIYITSTDPNGTSNVAGSITILQLEAA
jgi:hypothetical protein